MPTRATSPFRRRAPVFAALGDPTRLAIVDRLSDGSVLSITRLSAGSKMTRQAVTKHLGVLCRAGLVRGVRQGREQVYRLETAALHDAQAALDAIARQWDDALARLKSFVEDDGAPPSP